MGRPRRSTNVHFHSVAKGGMSDEGCDIARTMAKAAKSANPTPHEIREKEEEKEEEEKSRDFKTRLVSSSKDLEEAMSAFEDSSCSFLASNFAILV